MTIVEFLTARLDEDEAAAHEDERAPGFWSRVFYPARVLREVAAKRALIEDWRGYAERVARDDCDEAAGSAWAALSNVLVTLAGVHREHPDYAGDDVDDWTWPDDEARQVDAT